jgi:class 3 adenylate cyclase
MRTRRLVISVVSCDLRGFTAFAKATDPDRVIGILREYYQAVGRVVAQFGGTIKDQAGDGILILVGAPIAYEDHAQRAIDMAREIRVRAREVTARWSDERLTLGVGVGVASGNVAVGVIGDATRLEYTAVGTAVNLASRLCDRAGDGQVRIDAKTVNLCGAPSDARPAEPIQLKGFSQPVESYLL